MIRLILTIALTLATISSCASTTDDGDGDGTAAPDGPACFAHEIYAEIDTAGVDSVDLLFVVDNSESMRDEQASLSAQFRRMIGMLTSGDLDGDGAIDFPPVQSLHLGVVSTDLGLPGVNGVPSCEGLGDEGVLRNLANPDVAGCSAATYDPPFLTFDRALEEDPELVATDLECIATLGVDGCMFEQPLESALKAVWPGADQAVTFVPDTAGAGMVGNAGPGFPNGDFIRNDPTEEPSLVAIVLVTDEEDCSSRRMDHFLPGASPNGLNTRCFYENQRGQDSNLFQVNRYVELFKMLRPGREDLVIFAGIVGVPQRLTTPEFTADYDFDVPAESYAYFDMLLSAPEMQETLDDKQTPDVLDDDSLRPSCDRGPDAQAMPPRRIVEVAKGFGANGVIQSICQDDFGPAVDVIVRTIAGKLGAPCLPNRIPRSSDGVIDCEVTWELPRQAAGDAPTTCDALPFLTETDRIGAARGAICKVAQLAVDGGDVEQGDEGWYYDDFSVTTQQSCAGASKQRIAFTSEAKPPTGVTVAIHCFQANYYTDDLRTDLVPGRPGFEQPEIGSPCDMVTRNNQLLTGDEACVQLLVTGDEDTSLFCHPATQACALGCSEDDDCPDQWFCDDRAQTVDEADGHAVCSPGVCSAGATSAAIVGDPCLPLFVPENGFDDAQAYVEGNHPYCDGGACVVFHLEGDPREDCFARDVSCATSQDIEERVYCSCRCDAPEGFAECACPDGFTCAEALDHGPAEIIGSYCVRDRSVAQ